MCMILLNTGPFIKINNCEYSCENLKLLLNFDNILIDE